MKAYCVLDLEKMNLLLCGQNDGKVLEKVPLDNRLYHIETSLTNKVDYERFHPMGEKQLLDGLEMPLSYCLPFVLFFTNAEMMLFWASTLTDYTMWKEAFQKLIQRQHMNNWTKYVLRSKENAFLTTLYVSLKRKPVTEQEIDVPDDGVRATSDS